MKMPASPQPGGQLFRRARGASGRGKKQIRMAVNGRARPQVVGREYLLPGAVVFCGWVAGLVGLFLAA